MEAGSDRLLAVWLRRKLEWYPVAVALSRNWPMLMAPADLFVRRLPGDAAP